MAAAKKNKSRRQGLVSKISNVGLILLGLSRPLTIIFGNLQNPQFVASTIIKEATFGLSEGRFDTQAGARFYSPVGAAAAVGYLKSYLMRKFPVRR